MTKRFCDICEKLASVKADGIEVRIPFRDNDINQEFSQCYITANVRFGFLNHRQGFGGPPDLCDECIGMLIDQLRRKNESN